MDTEIILRLAFDMAPAGLFALVLCTLSALDSPLKFRIFPATKTECFGIALRQLNIAFVAILMVHWKAPSEISRALFTGCLVGLLFCSISSKKTHPWLARFSWLLMVIAGLGALLFPEVQS